MSGLLLLALGSACAPAGDDGSAASAGDDIDPTSGAHPRAEYLTSLTFVGFEADPTLAHFRFANRADRNRLVLTYRAWAGGQGGWQLLMAMVDTLPVARAAWRVLPGNGLRLGVGDGAQIDWLTVGVDGTTLRVQALESITSWSSSTGQRESLRSGELRLGDDIGLFEPGLLLERRAARPLDTERPPTASGAFMATDTLGNGLIVLRDPTLPDAPASVWAFLDGERIEWTDAVLISLAGEDDERGRWSLEIPDDGIVAEIETVGPASGPDVGPGSPVRLFAVDATLSAGDLRWTMSGIGIDEAGP